MQSKNKILGLLLVVFIFPSSALAATVAIFPQSISNDGYSVSLTSDDWTDLNVQIFFPDGSSVNNQHGADTVQSWYGYTNVIPGTSPSGIYHIVSFTPSLDDGDCSDGGGNYASCIGGESYAGQNLTLSLGVFSLISGAQAASFLTGAATGVQATAGTLWEIVAVAIGIPLAFFVISFVLALFPKKRR